MLLDAIFIQKEGNNDIDLFKQSFANVISFEGKILYLNELRFNYSIQKSEGQKGIRLKIATIEGRSTKKEADNIVALKNAMTKGKHRSNYHIVFIFDGASEYYCSKLTRVMSIFERKLRQFIYLNVLDVCGKEWIKETLSEEIQAKVNRNESNKNRHIEMALDCFAFQDYINYLFTKRSIQEPEEVIQEAKLALEKGEVSNKDIINILGKGEKLSLWEKFFRGFNIDFDEDEIDTIRSIRNDIMHNKEIFDTEFVEYKNLIRNSINKLDKGISNIEKRKYSASANTADVLYALNETMQRMRELFAEAISPALREISKMSQKFAETSSSLGLFEKRKELTSMFQSTRTKNKSLALVNLKFLELDLKKDIPSISNEQFKSIKQTLLLQNERFKRSTPLSSENEISENVDYYENSGEDESK